MTVSDYISKLLYTEDCVIVPGFGGFVTNYQEAKINYKTTEVFPPSKTIAFNQKLQNDDGLLIKNIASCEKVSYEAASNQVSGFVKKINSSLDNGKSVQLKALGTFTKKKSVLVFKPDASVNYLKYAYGLDSFEFPLLKASTKQLTQPKKTLTPVKKQHRRPAMAPLLAGLPIIAALIYAPFFFQEKEYENVFGKAGIEIPMGINKRIIALNASDFNLERQILHSEPDENTEKPEETDTPETEDATPEKTIKETETSTEITGSYFIIGGSFSTIKNAEKAVSQYENMGYSCRILPADNGMNRIAIESYESFDAAYQNLDYLRETIGNDNLWILKK
jgi:nucleoid DNA-binding protein